MVSVHHFVSLGAAGGFPARVLSSVNLRPEPIVGRASATHRTQTRIVPANLPPQPDPAGLNAAVGPITNSVPKAKDRDALLTERLLDPYNWQGVLRE